METDREENVRLFRTGTLTRLETKIYSGSSIGVSGDEINWNQAELAETHLMRDGMFHKESGAGPISPELMSLKAEPADHRWLRS